MKKQKMQYVCQTCGTLYSKWTGQCTGCNEWNTIAEEIMNPQTSSRYQGFAGQEAVLTRMIDVKLNEKTRTKTGLSELDRVLGGGLILGSAILLGGDPGIGKSTLLLQSVAHLSQSLKVLYVSGEESLQQITIRARRLELPQENLWLLAETQIETILNRIQQEKPNIIVVDSIQTMHTALLSSAPGSVGQVRESAIQLVNYAKQTETALFLVGHVTKEGNIAGPRVLEHMVDTVLYFEGEQENRYRIVRANKNRFGAVNELGIFAMTDKGLKEVSHPSAIFLSRYTKQNPGGMITATKEGSRPMLVEVQALVDQNHSGNPRRLSVGIDGERLTMLLAILNRQCRIATHHLDVFLNVVGGLEIIETGADLAALFAILSSLQNVPIPQNIIAFGEIGLLGEVRPVSGGQERLKEASKHGFETAIIPKSNQPKEKMSHLTIHTVETIKEAVECFESLIKQSPRLASA